VRVVARLARGGDAQAVALKHPENVVVDAGVHGVIKAGVRDLAPAVAGEAEAAGRLAPWLDAPAAALLDALACRCVRAPTRSASGSRTCCRSPADFAQRA
jgi:hypothetical protein